MKAFRFLVLLPILLILTACPDSLYSFTFTNNSTSEVFMYLNLDYLENTLYPDTSIARVRTGYHFEQGKSYNYDYSYEYLFKRNDTVSMFIFDADTINLYSWEEIQSGYKILQRYDISAENFKALKYTITYPPTEAMKDVKMYPPYGQ